jgi:DNA-binding response OmpR family regulator
LVKFPPMTDTGAEPRKRMIVVCDDNAALTALIQHLLKKKGFLVQTAGDGREGLDLIRETSPDLLLLDLAMPGLDGLKVLEVLGASSAKKPYTIVISGQETRDRASALGSNEVWKKPFNAASLISRIESLIAQGAI